MVRNKVGCVRMACENHFSLRIWMTKSYIGVGPTLTRAYSKLDHFSYCQLFNCRTETSTFFMIMYFWFFFFLQLNDVNYCEPHMNQQTVYCGVQVLLTKSW